MKYTIHKTLLLLLIALMHYAPAVAQGCFSDVQEEELLNDFREVKRLQNSAVGDNTDSLVQANKKFFFTLLSFGENQGMIISDVNRFMYEGVDFSVSDDYQCCVFSWDISSFLGMHQRTGILFYKTSEGIKSIQYTSGAAPFAISAIHTQSNKTVYLLFLEDEYVLKSRYKMVMARVIEAKHGPEAWEPESFFHNSKTDSTTYLEYKYDIESYAAAKPMPNITLSPDKRKLSVPIVSVKGAFDGRNRVYNFDGNKMILSPENK